jgi:hypothetical protein
MTVVQPGNGLAASFLIAFVVAGCAHDNVYSTCNGTRPRGTQPSEQGWQLLQPADLNAGWTWVASTDDNGQYFADGSRLLRWHSDHWETFGTKVVAFGLAVNGAPQVLSWCGAELCLAIGTGQEPARRVQPVDAKTLRSYVNYVLDAAGDLHAFGYHSCVPRNYSLHCERPFHARWTANGWQLQDLDSVPSAVAVDPRGPLHTLTIQKKQIIHATFDGRGWRQEKVAGLDQMGAPVFIDDFRIDRQGRIFALLAYRRGQRPVLSFAEREPSGWSLSEISDLGFAYAGSGEGKAAVDRDGRPHVIFATFHRHRGFIKHSSRGGDGAWRIDVIEEDDEVPHVGQLVLDASGRPALFYQSYDRTSRGTRSQPRMARLDGDRWRICRL